MRKYICSLMMASMVFGLAGSTSAADKDTNRDAFEQRADAVNHAADKKGRMKIALERISTETGVPLDQVQSLHKHYPEIGAAGLLSACVLAGETKKAPETFLKQHSNGKSWASLAHSNNVSLEKLNERLDHLENALGTSTDKVK